MAGYEWITKGDYENFRDWLNKNKYYKEYLQLINTHPEDAKLIELYEVFKQNQ